MRVNLGKIVVLLLAPMLLFSAHRWELEVSKTELVLGEATLLSYTCFFDSEAYGTSIDMAIPKEHDDYSIEVYKESERVIDDKRQNLFQYVLFPKRSGVIDVVLSAGLRKTSREQVENAVIGRDNVEYYQFEKTQDILPLTRLHVKPSPSKLVGDFALHVELNKEELSSFEPLHVSITFEGVGNLNHYKPFDLELENVDIFTEQSKRDYYLTPEGFKGSITQKFAIVSDHNFTLPPFLVTTFNPTSGKERHLEFKSKVLHVRPSFTKEELLDPPSEDEVALWSWTYLYYFLTLVLGIFLGWYARLYVMNTKQKPKKFSQAKDAKSLLTHLALQGGHEKLIEKAENEQWSLKQIEKALND
ncbi:MAG: hypothetical protein U9N52_14070 [Campylobacterota bacterium]|nr:hypothetical protein [Campylobacterota bacterium]